MSKDVALALLGHSLWREQFCGAEDILGESVVLDGEPHTVIGVLRPAGVAIVNEEFKELFRPGVEAIAVGIALGTVSALAAGRLLSSFLFQVSATDLRVYALVIAILVASGFLANWLPARRACAIDPMDSLRAD